MSELRLLPGDASDNSSASEHLSISPPHQPFTPIRAEVSTYLPLELHAHVVLYITNLEDLYRLRAVNKFYYRLCMEQLYERYLRDSKIDFWPDICTHCYPPKRWPRPKLELSSGPYDTKVKWFTNGILFHPHTVRCSLFFLTLGNGEGFEIVTNHKPVWDSFMSTADPDPSVSLSVLDAPCEMRRIWARNQNKGERPPSFEGQAEEGHEFLFRNFKGTCVYTMSMPLHVLVGTVLRLSGSENQEGQEWFSTMKATYAKFLEEMSDFQLYLER